MVKSKILLLILVILLVGGGFVAIRSHHIDSFTKNIFYYGEAVEISGRLTLKTFPGPPNYDSIQDGDKPETCWYLELSQPIDVLARSGDPDNDDAKDVNLVQLIVFWGTKEVEAYKSGFKEGSNLKIRGTLSSRLTGHHHAPVLIEVTGLSRI